MCGICGVIRFDGTAVARAALGSACDRLRHRGPDHTGVWVDPSHGAGIGATRLKVLDPSANADQPLHHVSGRYHLVYNGEVYNFRELRAELEKLGQTFVTNGDTEVVLAACARFGVAAFQKFNGMWALAFYDSQDRSGFLARDRFGIKPLCYVADEDALLFASELPALTRLGEWDRSIDPDALVQYVQFGYVTHPATMYARARRLPPGHFLTFGSKGVGPPTRYYEPHPNTRTSERMDYGEACERVYQAMADAVVRRRVSDVPIGAFLSGGLDSSIVVSHLAAAVGRPIQTFSVGYEGQSTYDETRFARLVSQRFGTEHHELMLTQREVLEAIPRILDHLGEPFGDSSILPTALLSHFARGQVTVSLSGDGGDELFGGYWRYLGHSAMTSYERIPRFVRRAFLEPALQGLSASRSSGFGNRVRQLRKLLGATHSAAAPEDPLARHVAWSRILAPDAGELVLDAHRSSLCDRRRVELARQCTSRYHGEDWLNRVLAFDLQCQLPCDMLAKVDLASMMHSLEVRVPFLDYQVVELALSLPGRFKIDRGLRKRILVDAYRGRVPDEVLDRSKQGFEVPVGEYLRGPLREVFLDTVNRPTVESFGLLDYSVVEGLYAAHADRRADHADLLWALLSLCWWRRSAVGGQAGRP